MRPAVMIGTEDRILNTWAHFAKKYSFLPLIGDGSTKYVFRSTKTENLMKYDYITGKLDSVFGSWSELWI